MRLVSFTSVLALAAGADAAVIQSVPFSNIPLSNQASVFDYTHNGNSYSLGIGTTFNSSGNWDVRDLFGGQFGASEPGDVLFADSQSIGTVETVLVTLASPVAITTFDVWVAEDTNGTGDRSTREFKLFAGTTLLDDVQLLNTSGNQTLTNVYGGNAIEVSDTLSNAPTTASYTLEFVQNQAAGSASGLRAVEFEAFVPEPASCALIIFAGVSILARRRRI